MTTLVNIAEVLAGEALVSPGGLVDRATAVVDDDVWYSDAAMEVMSQAREAVPAALVFA